MSNLFWGNLNSSLGTPFALGGNFGESTDSKSSFISKISSKYKTSTANTRIVDSNKSDSSKSAESSLRGRIVDSPKQSKQNKCASAHRISPASWCKKSESKGAEVPPADFLLEAEKRGSPPKSEKRSFWRVGGAGRGVQPFLRKEKGDKELKDSSVDLSTESCKKIDSNLLLDSRDLDSSLTAFAQNDESLDCFGQSPRNDDIFLDSSLRATHYAQNDKSAVDCHELQSISHNYRKKTDSTNQMQKTTEEIAVEVLGFLANFECETRLGVCEHSKFAKSTKDAPKSELPRNDATFKANLI